MTSNLNTDTKKFPSACPGLVRWDSGGHPEGVLELTTVFVHSSRLLCALFMDLEVY